MILALSKANIVWIVYQFGENVQLGICLLSIRDFPNQFEPYIVEGLVTILEEVALIVQVKPVILKQLPRCLSEVVAQPPKTNNSSLSDMECVHVSIMVWLEKDRIYDKFMGLYWISDTINVKKGLYSHYKV